jgi:hypothetical protein
MVMPFAVANELSFAKDSITHAAVVVTESAGRARTVSHCKYSNLRP